MAKHGSFKIDKFLKAVDLQLENRYFTAKGVAGQVLFPL